MADRPRDDTWWIASDGKWYPPTLQPDPDVEPEVVPERATISRRSTDVPALLTRFVLGSLTVTSAAFAVAAFFGIRYGSALRRVSISALDTTAAEGQFLGWSSFALFTLAATGVVVLAWTFQTSRALDARSPAGRRWRGGWTIGAWFIPLASFVLPKLVFNELEKIAQVPHAGDEIGEKWKDESRTAVGDLWWLLWVTGLFALQMTQVLVTDPSVDEGTLAVATSISGIAHAVLAGAGVALYIVIRRIERTSRT